jgi:5'-3' exonuclease
MIEKYGDDEDKNLGREEILGYDENVERIYTLFSTKEKNERNELLEKYQKEAEEEQEKLTEEYLTQKKELDKLVQEMKKLILKFEDERQKSYDENEADELLDNIE